MGETCSTQRASDLKRTSAYGAYARYGHGDVAVRLNEGRRFHDEYNVGSKLAPKVRSVRNKVTQATYVAYTLERMDLPCQDVEVVVSSIKRLQSLDHPNICRLLEAFEDDYSTPGESVIHLVYEKAMGLPLLKYIAQNGFSEAQAANLVQQVARALKHAEDQGIHHGAVVPKNIFVSSTGKVMLTDFGLAYLLKPSPLDGALEEDFAFLPPEALQPWLDMALAHTDAWGRQKHVQSMKKPAEGSKAWKKEYVRKDFWSSAGDMWALGIILFNGLCGRMPFRAHGGGALGLATDVVSRKLDIMRDFQDILSSEACEALSSMLQKNPARRPSAEELLQQRWLRKSISVAAPPVRKRICQELSTFVAETHFKKMVMRMLVTKMPPKKILALQEAFDAVDANRDGQVTLLELKRGLAQFPELCEGLDAPIEDVFAAIDVDKGGKVSLHEFLAATLDSHGVVTDAVINEAFRCLDANGDGKLSKEELAIAAREIDGHLGHAHLEDLLCKVEEELGPRPLNRTDFHCLVKEEGQRASRYEAVAQEAASQRWPDWFPCGIQCSRVERVIIRSSGQAQDAEVAASPPLSPKEGSARRSSRRVSKQQPGSGRRSSGATDHTQHLGSGRKSTSSRRVSGACQETDSTQQPGSGRRSGRRESDVYQEARSKQQPGVRSGRSPSSCRSKSPVLHHGIALSQRELDFRKGLRSPSPVSSECSTQCSSSPRRGLSRVSASVPFGHIT